ncbi:MAG: hypothetical protein D6718_09325 [Acidobacteria bacterium]|nr:MAG: hypothetical protein D6718_09325 [Acidobacteriota bacterium]
MPEPLVLRTDEDGVTTLTINRPDKLNALDSRVIRELVQAFRDAGEEESVRGLVVTGAGEKAFVAGADIAEMAGLSPEQARAFAAEGQRLGRIIDETGKPVVAAVNGYALGGGCELALACHLRVASPKARFGQPEVGLGLIPGFGGTQRLARLVGEGRALQMILTGRPIDASTAHAWGLVNEVAEDPVARAKELVREIAGKGPLAVRLCIEAVRHGLDMPLPEALAYEAALFGVTFGTEDMREGTRAFLEKRPARFQGR